MLLQTILSSMKHII